MAREATHAGSAVDAEVFDLAFDHGKMENTGSFQSRTGYSYSKTSSLHWKSKLRNAWDSTNAFLHWGDVLGMSDIYAVVFADCRLR